MGKLLRANFACLWKNRIFWLCMVFVFGLAVCFMEIEGANSPDLMLFKGGQLISLVFSVFISFYIGTEYSDGTIRNKIIAGHSRLPVYFADFIVCVVGSAVMYLIYVLVVMVVAVSLRWEFQMPPDDLVLAMLCVFVTIIAYTAIFMLVCMLVGNRSEGMVMSFLVLVMLMMTGSYITDEIATNGQEYRIVSVVSGVDESGEYYLESVKTEKNLYYLTGTKRKVYQFLNDFLPSCQIQRLVQFPEYYGMDMEEYSEFTDVRPFSESIEDIRKFPLYSLAVIAVATACGVFFFRIKNIK